MPGKFCASCGASLENAGAFCAACGAKTENPPQPSAQSAATATVPRPAAVFAGNVPYHPQRKKPKGLTILLSIAATATLLLFLLLHLVRGATVNALVMTAVDETGNMGGDLVTMAENAIGSSVIREYNISTSDLRDFMQRGSVINFVTDTLDDYLKAYLNGNTNYSLSTKDVSSFLKKNKKAIEQDFGITLSDGDIRDIVDYLDEKDADFFSPRSMMPGSIGDGEGILRFLFSGFWSALFFIVTAVCVVLIFFLNKDYISSALTATGVIGTVGGGLFTLAGLLMLAGSNAGNDKMMQSFLARMAGSAIVSAVIVLLAGIVCLVLSKKLRPAGTAR